MAIITLAIATKNDPEGLWYTINSAILSVMNTNLAGKLAFAVVDNSDTQDYANQVHSVAVKMGAAYKRITFPSNHLARNEAVRLSETEYTVLCDSHVLFSHGFFSEYVDILSKNPNIGLVHSCMTNGGTPTHRGYCCYNLQRFEANLHGILSSYGALANDKFPVGLQGYGSVGFRTEQWLEYGGFIEECAGHGGGEVFVSYKYWMFGSSVYTTTKVGLIHRVSKPYKRTRTQWFKNFTTSAFALGGYEVGCKYAVRLRCKPYIDELWKIAKPYHKFVLSKQKFPFSELINHFKKVRARPFISGKK